MRPLWSLVAFLASTVVAAPEAGGPPKLALTLDQTLQSSLAHSDQWKATQSAADAAEDQARAQRGALFPKLSLDGSFRYIQEIPVLAVAPGAPPLSFTTHNSYLIGPVVRWTAFSGGTLYQAWLASQAQARAQKLQADATWRQIRLAARLAYFQAQLAAEQVRLYAESYRVEQSRYHDMSVRHEAGQAARVDWLAAEEDLLARQNLLLQSRSNLAGAIRDLTSLARMGEDFDATWPVSPQTALSTNAEMPAPTLILQLDPLADSLARMEPGAQSASLTREYPNGPIKEDVTQKTVGINLSFPLFAGGQTLFATRAQQKMAEANQERRAQSARDFLDSWQKARDQVASLLIRQKVSRRLAERAAEVARLRYEAYKVGELRYLDVEDADLRELQAKVDAAITDVTLLIQLANLESLSEE
jgi:outer membrane protein TolC